jgi:hypothetical protein
MKETFQTADDLKRARVVQNYAVSGAAGALFFPLLDQE